MGKYAVVVIGPAGSGKSTLCTVLNEHYASALGRTTHIMNMDPAAEGLPYEPSVDIRDLISLEDAMEGKGLGPNGGLVFCMEYLVTAGESWLVDQIGDYAEDFMIVDMPGQVEVLFSQPAVPTFVRTLRREGYFTTVVYVIDALAGTADTSKFISGCMFSLSSMVHFDCPFVNVLSKCDLLSEAFKEDCLEHFCSCDFAHLDFSRMPSRLRAMSYELCGLLSDFSLMTFRPLDVNDTDSVTNLVAVLDDTLQVADEQEVNDREFEDDGDF